MAEQKNPGEDKAWEILGTLDPAFVSRAASVSYDTGTASYSLASFGMDFIVSVRDRTITSAAAGSEVLLKKLGSFFRLSALWYLASARDGACTGRLVKLESIRGGDIFTKGSHVLPLDSIALRYGGNNEEFLAKGRQLGGVVPDMRLGDVSIRLYPLPRVPVILTLWLEDEEFPARADLLFDSSCDLLLPTDIIWSVAMMSLMIML